MSGYEEKLTALQTFVGRVQESAVGYHVGYIVSIHSDDNFEAKPSVLVAPGTVTYHRPPNQPGAEMKIDIGSPTATNLVKGSLDIETWDANITVGSGTLRIYERGDGKLGVIGNVAISALGDGELMLEVQE